MKRILFIGHGMHTQTSSSRFFETILRERFEVKCAYLSDGPAEPFDAALLDRARQCDLVVLWQRDFLAPAFLGMGIPTVVIPMFDGSAILSDSHWIIAKQARFVNFCLHLNEKIRYLGGQSLLTRYFPEPAPEAERVRFDDVKPFMWVRRPHEGINLKLIDKLLGNQADKVHIHNCPDPGSIWPADCPEDADFRYNVSRTSWGKTNEAYLAALRHSNVYFAPRIAEGIGMGFLEAMARGMLVIAWDQPTHNEYISNWLNGILYSGGTDSLTLPTGADAYAIGYQAWRTVVEGRKAWEASIPTILDWVENTPKPERTLEEPLELATQLWRKFFGGLESYEKFLRDNIDIVRHLGGLEAVAPSNASNSTITASGSSETLQYLDKIDEEEAKNLHESGDFDADWYASYYPDVQVMGIDPTIHYLWIGRWLGRRPRAARSRLR